MSSFSISCDFVLDHEGGFSNNPNDHGGPTAYGFSARYLEQRDLERYDLDKDGVIGVNDMRHFTKIQAIYEMKMMWFENHFDIIESTDIAKRVFDFGFNAGMQTGIKIFQNTVNRLYKANPLVEDGIIGQKTADAVNILDLSKQVILCEMFKSARAHYYQTLVMKNPKLEEFEKGWIKRAYS